jgi:MFS transporter, CP family, cyanate transporter
MSANNSNIQPPKRTAELEELLIDAEADDEQIQQSHPILRRPWLLLLGLVLVALNLRPALSACPLPRPVC